MPRRTWDRGSRLRGIARSVELDDLLARFRISGLAAARPATASRLVPLG